MTIGQLRSLLGSFLFSGDDVFKKAGVLSGGEKSRVALARILLQKSNLIVLDEPTNHLDLSSKEILQKALIDFSGSLIIVSHDVDFLSPIIDKVVEIKEGHLKIFSGGIDYYLSKREELSENGGMRTDQGDSMGISRKDLKRIEAEKRQKKYAATKDLSRKISILEKEIEVLENKHQDLETIMADPEFYTKGDLVKEKIQEMKILKNKLEDKINSWTSLSEKLSEIEKEFI
jgi:ATP-binding cassette, subfamily F, member 3